MDEEGHLNLTGELVEVDTSLIATVDEVVDHSSSLHLDDADYIDETITINDRKQELIDGVVVQVLDSGILETLPSAAETNLLINSGQVSCDNHFKNQVFSEVVATISNTFLQMLPEIQCNFLQKLNLAATVCYENKENGGACVLRGNLQQIVEAQKLLETLLVDGDPGEANGQPLQTDACQAAKICDKGVLCDIIKLDKLSHFALEHPRKARFSSLLLRQSASRIASKSKLRFHRKLKRTKNVALTNSDKKTIPSSGGLMTADSEILNMSETSNCDNRESPNADGVENLSDSDECSTLMGENGRRARIPNAAMDEGQLISLPSPQQLSACGDEDLQRKNRRNYEELTPYKFFCKQCSFKTKRESHYLKHLLIHDKVKTLYNCESCSFTTIRLSHLRRHEISHSQTTFNCGQCSYKTDELKLLTRHVKLRHKEEERPAPGPTESLQCSQCPYNTVFPYHYKRHLRVHDGHVRNSVHVHQCVQCPYKTSRKEHYIRHVNNVHSNKRPHLCETCGRSFKRPDALKQHVRATHGSDDSKALQFSCCTCNKKCHSQAHLNEHQAVHSNVRSYLCEICGASFKTRSVQRKHIATIHKNPRAHSCQHCDKRFNTNFALRRHLRLHSNEATAAAEDKVLVDALPNVHERVLSAAIPGYSGGAGNTLSFTLHQDDPTSSSAAQLTFSGPIDSLQLPVMTEGSALVAVQEAFEQASDALIQDQQAYAQANETPTTMLYLTANFTQF